MRRLAIVRDATRCIGCCACMVACKMERDLPPRPTIPPVGAPEGISLITVHDCYGPGAGDGRVVQFFQPVSCMHCADPPCLKVCPTLAIRRDSEVGAVLVERSNCIGCRLCLHVCPFGAPRFDEEGRMVLCDMCVDRLRRGERPACETVCPAKAVHVGTAEDIGRSCGRRFLWRLFDLPQSADAVG